MWYEEVKIYHDGSHYVGIPHTTNPKKRRKKPKEEVFEVEMTEEEMKREDIQREMMLLPEVSEETEDAEKEESKPKVKCVTRISEFEKYYEASKGMEKTKRKKYLMKNLRQYFRSGIEAECYVEKRLKDKKRALFARRLRFVRKAYMHDFNYFVTLTYDDKKHTEESFKKGLKKSLENLHTRKGWKYMGVWERASKSGRLHFHGLLEALSGTMPGELITVRDYNLNTKRMQVTVQNTYFNEQFGRSDFEEIEKSAAMYASAIAYILKYIEKTGERLVYSRGTPTYLVSDIHEDDVITRMGEKNEKILLADDFICWLDGEYIGRIGKNTKRRMKTCN